MSRTFYAHSGNETDYTDWQTLADHLNNVGRLAAENASGFNAEPLAEICGLLHDIGKYSEEFAQRLEGGKRVDHSTAGAKIAVEKWGVFGKLIAFAVAGHHAGLANGVDAGDSRSTLDERLKSTIPSIDEIWKKEISLPAQLVPPPHFSPRKNYEGFQYAFLTRMLFSCLVDADFIDTERFYRSLEKNPQQRGNRTSVQTLKQCFDQHLDRLTNKSAVNALSPVNSLRQHVLHHVKSQSQLSTGLFSLTVPTGGGKTLTSMAFALDHACHYQQRRVIYVIPFTSIIDQNARVFREAFKPLGDDIVLEHHSNFDDTSFQWKEETKDKLKLAAENWDVPVVVTTAVQFFESLFADRTSKCRKLHNIANSVIILDEAQMLPLKLLRPTMAAIDELARNYRCSIVLCTATQPALNHADGFSNGFEGVREIAPDPASLYKALDRVTVRHIGVQTDEQLVERLLSHHQALIIVNNRRQARHLFDLLGSDHGHVHLSTFMCAVHRTEKLKMIRQRLAAGEPCRVVSTSLIEAGVDVDFPFVMRSESGLDSIAQAAGRCNREGRNKKEDSEVLVFSAPDWKPPAELQQQAGSMRSVVRNHSGELLAPAAIKAYFQDLFWRNPEQLDHKGLLKKMREHTRQLTFPFQTIAKEYRLIESVMHLVIIPFDNNARQLINQLRFTTYIGSIARKLQPYTVQVPTYMLNELKAANVLEDVNAEHFGEQFRVLIGMTAYDCDAGLNWETPGYISAQDSVM